MKVSSDTLVQLGACSGGVSMVRNIFKRKLKAGVEITPDTVGQFIGAAESSGRALDWMFSALEITSDDRRALENARSLVSEKCRIAEETELAPLRERQSQAAAKLNAFEDDLLALVDERTLVINLEYKNKIAADVQALGDKPSAEDIQLLNNNLDGYKWYRGNQIYDVRNDARREVKGSPAYMEVNNQIEAIEKEINQARQKIREENRTPYYVAVSNVLNQALERKLTKLAGIKTLNINWSTAPAWANYHAFDQTIGGYWYSHKPIISIAHWAYDDEVSTTITWRMEPSGYVLPTGADWKDTLTARPAA